MCSNVAVVVDTRVIFDARDGSAKKKDQQIRNTNLFLTVKQKKSSSLSRSQFVHVWCVRAYCFFSLSFHFYLEYSETCSVEQKRKRFVLVCFSYKFASFFSFLENNKKMWVLRMCVNSFNHTQSHWSRTTNTHVPNKLIFPCSKLSECKRRERKKRKKEQVGKWAEKKKERKKLGTTEKMLCSIFVVNWFCAKITMPALDHLLFLVDEFNCFFFLSFNFYSFRRSSSMTWRRFFLSRSFLLFERTIRIHWVLHWQIHLIWWEYSNTHWIDAINSNTMRNIFK